MIWYPVFLGFWRRWFGGGLDFLGDNRAIQHIAGGVVFMLNMLAVGQDWLSAILGACAFQGLFWARSHGCCFDFGHSEPDPERYEQLWYWKYIKRIIPESEWYGYTCDFILMLVRYTLPALVVAFIIGSPVFCLAGLGVTLVYAYCWNLFDRGRASAPTETAEIFSGMLVGALLI